MLLFCFVGCFLLFSCNKEENDPVILDVRCDVDTLYSGDKVEFFIRAVSSWGRLREVSLHSFNHEIGRTEVTKFEMDDKSWKEYYIYTVPAIESDTLKHTMTFQAVDSNSDKDTYILPLTLIKQRKK